MSAEAPVTIPDPAPTTPSATPAAPKAGEKPVAPTEPKAGEKPVAPVAPAEPVDYELKAPEGTDFSGDVLDTYKGIAKELKLDQKGAQKLVDAVAPKIVEKQRASIEAVQTSWAKATRADKEIGGAKLDATLADAGQVLHSFGSPELRAFLRETKLESHPEMLRMLSRIKAVLSDDALRTGKPTTTTKPREYTDAAIAARLYNN